jgi:hypothetical protein
LEKINMQTLSLIKKPRLHFIDRGRKQAGSFAQVEWSDVCVEYLKGLCQLVGGYGLVYGRGQCTSVVGVALAWCGLCSVWRGAFYFFGANSYSKLSYTNIVVTLAIYYFESIRNAFHYTKRFANNKNV